jgi:hypothetical protein
MRKSEKQEAWSRIRDAAQALLDSAARYTPGLELTDEVSVTFFAIEATEDRRVPSALRDWVGDCPRLYDPMNGELYLSPWPSAHVYQALETVATSGSVEEALDRRWDLPLVAMIDWAKEEATGLFKRKTGRRDLASVVAEEFQSSQREAVEGALVCVITHLAGGEGRTDEQEDEWERLYALTLGRS